MFDEVVSPQLFGAMMSALNMFAEQLTEGGLSNFELNNRRFTLIKKKQLIFVANSSKKINQKKIDKELGRVSKKFFKLYSDQLLNFKGKIGIFSNFKESIEDALAEKVDNKPN